MNFPVSRKFIPLKNPCNSNTKHTFRVLTYNVLGPTGLYRELYPYSSKQALKWNYRKKNLLQEIADSCADIIALQEVNFYETFWNVELGKLGYESKCKKNIENKEHSNGCAIFYKKSRLAVRDAE
jgi:mRNA deadenylase 3'-5' endonuclease subunit Ccr4